jgi:hypothetical protein
MGARMTTESQRLAREVLAAKVAFWDALRALEMATVREGETEWTDRTSDAVEERVSFIAASGDAEQLSDEELQELVDVASADQVRGG